jgi:tetratricopeptide (TPR) repeat protein
MYKGMQILVFLFFALHLPVYNFAQNKEEILLREISSSKTQNSKINKLIELHNFYSTTNRQKWFESIDLLKKEALKIESEELKGRLFLSMGSAYLELGNIPDFKKCYELNIANKKFLRFEDNHLQRQLAIHYLVTKKDALASIFSLKHIAFSKKNKQNRFISEAYISRSLFFMQFHLKDSAIYYANLATDFAKRSDTKICLALSLHHQAKVQFFFRNYLEAINEEFKFLYLAEELDHTYFKSLAYRSIAEISFDVGNFDETTIYLKKANTFSTRLSDFYEQAKLKIYFAKLFLARENLTKANNTISEAFATFKTFNDYRNIGTCTNVLGQIATQKSDYEKAINYFNSAISYFGISGEKQELDLVFINLGKLYLQKGDLIQAELYLLKVVSQVSKSGELSQNYKLLSELYFKKNQLQLAYNYQNLYLSILEYNALSTVGSKVLQLTESNLREERERLISYQKESIQAKEMITIQLTRQIFITVIFAVLLLFLLFFLIFRSRQNKLKQSQKEAELSQSLLRSQMNPHFIFNAMSGIQSYIYSHEPEKSSQFLVNFSRLIRLILENSSKEFIPLELELEIIEKYLTTQKMRFEDRFDFKLNIDELLIEKQALIPPMITQPFIENAIEHGQLHTLIDGCINISITEENKMLQIIISDNGVGRKGSKNTQKIKSHNSMAIDITRERIRIINQKFKIKGNLIIRDYDELNEIGTEVIIKIPLKFENN